MNDADDSPLFCDRCLRGLLPGSGDFYQVTIEAVADPAPPILEPTELNAQELRRELDSLVHDMEELSAREAMDQVHRAVTIHLCRRCYARWIENPAGS